MRAKLARVLFVPVPPAGMSGYAEFGWVIDTPELVDETTLVMPVAVAPPVFRTRSSSWKVSPGSR